MSTAWWYTGNEKRIAMGQDEDTEEPMMNSYLVPTTLQPIGNMNEDLNSELDEEINIDELLKPTNGNGKPVKN